MLRGRGCIIAALVMMSTLSILQLGDARGESTVVLFTEDFESSVWNPDLVVYDENLDSGEDYWGLTEFVAHSGTRSAAAAAIGTNSADGLPNIYAMGTYPNQGWIARYDNNMSASMDLNVGASISYDLRYVTFYYVAHTEPWIIDFLTVLALVDGQWQTLWSQTTTLTFDFTFVNISIPSGVEWISFHFYSDGDNSSYAGVFVDDITLYGMFSAEDDITPPSSFASVGETVTSRMEFNVSFAATDDISGLDYVELWMSINDSPFVLYERKDDVSGPSWEGVFEFNASSIGGYARYSFYTVAGDVVGNREPPPLVPDVTVRVASGGDVVPPVSLASVPERSTHELRFNVSFVAADDASGLDYIELWVGVESLSFVMYRRVELNSQTSASGAFEFDASDFVEYANYSFYTITVDVSGNRESPPSEPDSSVSVTRVEGAEGLPGRSISVLRLSSWQRESVALR